MLYILHGLIRGIDLLLNQWFSMPALKSKGSILAHRGLWESKHDGNSLSSLCNALDSEFGLETDIRDSNGEIIIATTLFKKVFF